MSKLKPVVSGLASGLGIGGASAVGAIGKKLIPDIPDPGALTALPTAGDPEIEAARKRQREQERLRSGRRASIMSGGQGVASPLGVVSRPEGRAAELFGG